LPENLKSKIPEEMDKRDFDLIYPDLDRGDFAWYYYSDKFKTQKIRTSTEIFKKKYRNRDIDNMLYGEPNKVPKKGNWIEYYDNGNKKLQGHIHNGRLFGSFKKWYKNGQLMVDLYEDGEVGLDNFTYYFENGKIQSGIVRAGSLHKYYEYYENGFLRIEGSFKNKKKEGKWVEYYKSYMSKGDLKIEMEYKDGLLNGDYKYYLRRVIRESSQFINNKYFERKTFHDNGENCETVNFNKNGELHGKYLIFSPKGFPRLISEYYRGQPVGENKTFNDYENLILEKHYFFDKDIGASKKVGTWKTFYKRGQIAVEIQYRDDYLHGTFKTWFENGNICEEGKHKDQSKVGTWNTFWPNGKLKSKIIFGEEKNKNGAWYEEDYIIKKHHKFECTDLFVEVQYPRYKKQVDTMLKKLDYVG
jgi:uncharacterized protein